MARKPAAWGVLALLAGLHGGSFAASARPQNDAPEAKPSRRPRPPKARKVKLHMELTGDLYYIDENTQVLPDFSKLKRVAVLRAKGLNVTPRMNEEFPGVRDRMGYFAIDFKGTMRIEKPGRYLFVLTSDDGSKLFIDDKLLIDNDGQHPPRAEEAEIDLAPGTYRIHVPFFQSRESGVALLLEAFLVGE
jgi:hypothetical protein